MKELLLIILNSLWIVGFYQTFQPGMVFERFNPCLYLNTDSIWIKWVFKPVMCCVVCMASVHGLLFLYFFAPVISNNQLFLRFDEPYFILHIFAVAGLNLIISRIADI